MPLLLPTIIALCEGEAHLPRHASRDLLGPLAVGPPLRQRVVVAHGVGRHSCLGHPHRRRARVVQRKRDRSHVQRDPARARVVGRGEVGVQRACEPSQLPVPELERGEGLARRRFELQSPPASDERHEGRVVIEGAERVVVPVQETQGGQTDGEGWAQEGRGCREGGGTCARNGRGVTRWRGVGTGGRKGVPVGRATRVAVLTWRRCKAESWRSCTAAVCARRERPGTARLSTPGCCRP